MKVARKLTLALIAGILLVHAAAAVVRVRREQELFVQDIARDSRLLGRTLGHAVQQTWRSRGEADALEILAHADEREAHVHIRWVWLDAHPPSLHAPAVAGAKLAPLWRGQSVVALLGQGDEAGYYTYVPVHLPGDRMGAIEVADPLADDQQYLHHSVINALIVVVVLVALCAALAWVLGFGLIGRPVARLVEQARAIGRGELDRRLNLPIKDELGELASEMDKMCDGLQQAREGLAAETQSRIAAIEQLRHAERLTTIGTLAAGVAHELGTPINVVDGHAQLIREDDRATGQLKEHAQIISRQCKRMTQIIRQLLEFARVGGPRAAAVDLADVVRETLRMVEPLLRKQGVESAFDEPQGGAAVRAGFNQVQQALINIVINALHAMPEGGRLAVRVASQQARRPGNGDAGAFHTITVEDSGVGIAPEALSRIFEPFFTTKDVGHGTGLGLSVAYGIIEDQGGWIDVQSELGRGSRFTIYLPQGDG